MKKLLLISTLFFLLSEILAQGVLPNLGGQRAGLSTLGFLKNDMSPRSMALGGASVAISPDAYSLYSNPAAASQLEHLTFSTTNYIVGAGVNQNMISAILPRPNSTSAFGFSINALTSGAMEVRTEFQPEGTGQQFFANNVAMGLTYSKQLSDMFSMGLSVKYIYEQLAEYTNHTASADLGFLYKTDFKDLAFAVMVQNFGGNSQLSGDFLEVNFNRNVIGLENYTVPTVFSLGFSMVPLKTDEYSLSAAMQLNHPNDNAENIRLGVEFEYRDLLFARLGYKLGVLGQNLPTFGFGVRSRVGAHPLRFDYGVNPTIYMGLQHCFGIAFSFNKMER